jgi:hypothetical protein
MRRVAPGTRTAAEVPVGRFSLSDENALQLLCDVHATYPQAPVGLISGDGADDVTDVVGLAGGTAVVVKPCAVEDVSTLR